MGKAKSPTLKKHSVESPKKIWQKQIRHGELPPGGGNFRGVIVLLLSVLSLNSYFSPWHNQTVFYIPYIRAVSFSAKSDAARSIEIMRSE